MAPRRLAPKHVRRLEDRPLVLAHRGASQRFPENTWQALDAAISMGADGVEIDVRRSADGVPVLAHDPDLRRTHGERVVIAHHPARLLPVATLEDVLTRMASKWPDAVLDVELKVHKEPHGPLPPDALGEIMDLAGWGGRTIVTSFDTRTVRRYSREGWTTGLLEGERHLRAPTAASLLAQYEADVLALRDPGHYRSVRDAVRNAGAALWVWTLNRTARIKVADRFAVDAILTDVPDHVRTILTGDAAPTGPVGETSTAGDETTPG